MFTSGGGYLCFKLFIRLTTYHDQIFVRSNWKWSMVQIRFAIRTPTGLRLIFGSCIVSFLVELWGLKDFRLITKMSALDLQPYRLCRRTQFGRLVRIKFPKCDWWVVIRWKRIPRKLDMSSRWRVELRLNSNRFERIWNERTDAIFNEGTVILNTNKKNYII